MKIIRLILGKLILLLNAIFSPKPQQRAQEDQQRINQALESMALYQFETCPFCVKVRRAAKKMNLPLETVDAKQPDNEQALLNGGGKRKVPCLRIENESGEVTWMYESNDIIHYLEQRFT
ncbi:glutathione S-transferase N-terminal domain-containing protein [Photobacterium lutimaris]|uniref:Glutaredoxin n=1 Tax=Photobacterium lutimaris TaxID=388278 RepID=A0A2T3J0B1_9GAMM|nr:glutathione S-transferase N-terminal domain-containing protein [Photobacterium lutimaris]PSU34373.1 glutaredoxin [Photobacterium lutimaris]TDR75972.1 glutathione S-transferase-like protein [Photobacterium lutimaris]